MKKLVNLLYLFFLINSSCTYTTLPSYLIPCSGSDPNFNECAIKSGREAIPYIIKGDATYHIPSFQPLKIDKVSLEASDSIKLYGTNLSIIGIDLIELKDIKIDRNNKFASIKLFTPLIRILGTYNMNGHILIMNLKGSGAMNNSHYDTGIEVTLKYSLFKKNGKDYFKIEDLNFKFEIKSTGLYFENILNNPKLSEQINLMLNENAKVLIEELFVSIKLILKDIALSIINPIIDKVPYDNIILP